mmetsp:Transcript_13087/g.15804  ORF Transcript_13087/g.15804 Transcript_13087/m.15804 type:complete len:218 (+) Transcript_13087:337-990(+)
MANCPLRFKDLVIIATLICLVAKEMNLLVVFQETEAICFIPALREHVKANLATDGICEVVIRELLLECFHHLLPHPSTLIKLLELIAFFLTAVASNRRYVEHASTEFDEGPSLDGDLEIRDIVENEVDKLLQFLLAQEILQALLSKQSSSLRCDKSVLREKIFVLVGSIFTDLFLDLNQVRASDDPNVNSLAKFLHELEHTGVSSLARDGECTIHIK